MQNPPLLRLSRPSDLADLKALDIKCYHYPITNDGWQDLLKKSGKVDASSVIIAEYSRQRIGFAVWWNLDEDSIEIMRLGVHPYYRRKGVGSLLLAKILSDTRHLGASTIQLTAPSVHCCPGDKDDISEFLISSGFKATGEIIEDFKVMYGDLVDGYIFKMRI